MVLPTLQLFCEEQIKESALRYSNVMVLNNDDLQI